jgi:hypothetical protein
MKSAKCRKSFRLLSFGIGHRSRPLRTHKTHVMEFATITSDILAALKARWASRCTGINRDVWWRQRPKTLPMPPHDLRELVMKQVKHGATSNSVGSRQA